MTKDDGLQRLSQSPLCCVMCHLKPPLRRIAAAPARGPQPLEVGWETRRRIAGAQSTFLMRRAGGILRRITQDLQKPRSTTCKHNTTPRGWVYDAQAKAARIARFLRTTLVMTGTLRLQMS
jgi:hypothetical protein